MAAATTVKLVIPSTVRLVDLVHGASERMAEIAGFDEEGSLNVALAVREALINAIKHGNHLDPSLTVEVILESNSNGFRATVKDRGQGFDSRITLDPTVGENRLMTSGRGLLLIRAFVDEVKFKYRKGRGMEVTLIKRLSPPRGADESRS